ncbi:hypothetical protein CRE_02799 [Caenorhabditis remanei]|uniref:Uncharacterized protein n=1 Tax=Caenorhabditis remanei TaxID=31234 RepID=E3NWZ5_CAERE|nr:hypothetical protein CRE_02799 [Caenorhabditis remanei]
MEPVEMDDWEYWGDEYLEDEPTYAIRPGTRVVKVERLVGSLQLFCLDKKFYLNLEYHLQTRKFEVYILNGSDEGQIK